MKNIINYIIIGLLVISNIILLYRNYTKYEEYKEQETITDTLFIDNHVIDTLPILRYKYIDKYLVDTLLVEVSDTIKEYLPVSVPINKYEYSNTLFKGSDTIKYRAHISGYRSILDSIDISIRYPTIINNTTNKYIDKGFYFSPQVGIGYGFFNKKPDIYVGVGFGYKF